MAYAIRISSANFSAASFLPVAIEALPASPARNPGMRVLGLFDMLIDFADRLSDGGSSSSGMYIRCY